MEDGVVIDSDVMTFFYSQFKDEEGDLYDLINDLLIKCGIAISDYILGEWFKTCSSYDFEVWVTDNIRDGKIRYVSPYLNNDIKNRIHNYYGLPRKCLEIHLIRASNVTGLKYILTNDIDLLDPRKKNASARERKRIRENRQGKLCKYLKRELDITVGLSRHCRTDLSNYLS